MKNLERFWSGHLDNKSSNLSGFSKLVPSETMVKTVVLEGFSILTLFIQSSIFDRFLLDFELQNETNFEYICPKIDPKFKLEFEGPNLEIFGDFLGIWEQGKKIFSNFYTGRRKGGVQGRGGGS